MSPSELASSLTSVLVGRDGAVSVTITDDWMLHVHGVSYSVGIRLTPDQRTPESAVAAVRAVAPWAIPWDRRAPSTNGGTIGWSSGEGSGREN